MSKNDIYVNKPTLPDLRELLPLLESIWSSAQLTNNGPLVQRLTGELETYFNAPHVALCNNGTLALLCALKACGLPKGSEVITTPYSFVATSSAIVWAGLKPVFVDVDPHDYNIDATKIEAAITENTSAILPVHCYGRPCKVSAIQSIADVNDLAVIYDAAHAFGVNCDCGELLSQGTASVVSFHATKVFNTFEGGCVVTKHPEIKRQIDLLTNFGFLGETEVSGIGINAKMSEFNAAVGLLQLKDIDTAIAQRHSVHTYYMQHLQDLPGLSLPSDEGYSSNYGYFPVLIEDHCKIDRDEVYRALKSEGVFPRRYFYPLISDFPDYAGFRKVDALDSARSLSKAVLCLPIYPSLTTDDLRRICILLRNLVS